MSAPSLLSDISLPAAERLIRGASVRVSPTVTSLVLLVADILSILVATFLGVTFWSIFNPSVTMAHYFDLGVSLLLFVAVYCMFGLYEPAGHAAVEELRRTLLATSLVFLALTAAVFLAKDIGAYSRGAFLCSSAIVAFLVPCVRSALRSLCASRRWWGVPVVILGAGKTARLLIETLKVQPAFGLKPIACLDDDPAKQGCCAGIPVPGPLSQAPSLAGSLRIRHAVVAMPGVDRRSLVSILERYGSSFAHIMIIPDLFGMASLWVTPRDMGGVLGLEVRQNLLIPVNRWVKRAMDLLLAGALGLLALPVMFLVAVWIKLVSAGSAFYAQEREGEGGRTIRVRKLRTMHPNSEQLLVKHLETSQDARREWQLFCKLKCDPRVLPGVGHLLRRTSLDELPQLWSVIKGEMSLVGPRPFPHYHLARFDPEFRALRNKVRPGLTGLWQVSARSDGDINVQQELDTYYIRNWSLWLELHILARTVAVVLLGRGAY
jgi:Undecaprenyl-phosphate galactose phosphotransferase WbaP